jgi:uncharacterized protein
VTACPGGAAIAVHVIPRAGASAIAGLRNGALLVRLAAAPVEGAANAALVSLLARTFGVAPRQITIVAGSRHRDKRVFIGDADPSTLQQILRELVGKRRV